MEKVSIIIPTYNREHQIKASVESILRQSYTNFELLIVDDGSKDNTKEVVESIEDERLRYIKLDANKGVGHARNEGVRQSRCALIAFQDSDDIWREEKLQRQMEYWQRHCDCSLIYCSYLAHVIRNGELQEEVKVPDEGWGQLSGSIFHSLLRQNTIGAPTILMRKECFFEVGGFDATFRCLEDWDFVLRVSERNKIGYLDEVLIDVFVGEDGISSQGIGVYFDCRCKMISRYKEHMIEDGIWETVLNDLFQYAEKLGVLNEVTKLLLAYIS